MICRPNSFWKREGEKKKNVLNNRQIKSVHLLFATSKLLSAYLSFGYWYNQILKLLLLLSLGSYYVLL